MATKTRVAAALIVSLLAAAVSHGETSTSTFEARSEGCSGGGDVCGAAPLMPGDAAYTHRALPDGTLEASAVTDSLVPACVATRCVPAVSRYHAESSAAAWVDVETPAGTTSVDVRIDLRLDEFVRTESPLTGSAVAVTTGTILAVEAPGSSARCSDGSSVVGRIQNEISSTPGAQTVTTAIGCSDGGVLSATRWRLGLVLRAVATSDGGAAEARVRAQLSNVTVDAA